MEGQRVVERLVVSFLGHILADERPGMLVRGLTVRPDSRPKGGPKVIRLLFEFKGYEVLERSSAVVKRALLAGG